jgi:hypothetical protein
MLLNNVALIMKVVSIPSLEPTQPSIQQITGAPFLGAKQLSREADH